MYPAPMPGVVVAPVAGFFPGAGAYDNESSTSSDLFDCFDDCVTCCLTCWYPCVTFGRTPEIVDRGGTASMSLLAWAYSCTYGSRMRAQLGRIHEAACTDFLVHRSGLLCALCQEYRELKARGYEPVLGWELINAQRAAAMSAPAAQGIGR